MKKLAIIGSGDLGQLMAFHAKSCGYEPVGFYDDFKNIGEKTKDGLPILGKIDAVEADFYQNKFEEIIIAVGYKHLSFKENLFWKLSEKKIPMANLIHQSAYLAENVQFGSGIFILPSCVLDSGVKLGNGVLLNAGACIAHDTHIGDFSFVAPAVALAGFIQVGKRCFIGINATLIDNLKIVDDVKIAAGAVVVKSIDFEGLYAGCPAKKIK